MQAHSEDRIVRPRPRSAAPWLLLLAILGGGGGWYWHQARQAGDAAVTPTPPVIQPTALAPAGPAPDTPAPASTELVPAPPEPPVAPAEVAASEPPVEPAAALPPLPALDESDDTLRSEAAALVGPGLQDLLASHWQGEHLLRRFVAFVSNLAEGKLDSKSSPLSPPKGRFTVTTDGPLRMTPESQARFNPLIQLVTGINPDAAAASYRRFYPLLQGAYADLGEKKTFHAVTLAAIDRLLATPEPVTEPELVPAEKGLYRYASPALEALPTAQKPLIRMGKENARELKAWLRRLKAALLAVPDEPAPPGR